jgi:methylmalonyl-CoA/ethylmalonyl-CoA epimerase
MKSLEFHHIGVACKDIESETKISMNLGYEIEGEDFIDPVQGVSGRFLVGGGPRLELLAPLTEKGV